MSTVPEMARIPVEMTRDQAIAFLEGHHDETFEVAKELARSVNYESAPEWNALRMYDILRRVFPAHGREPKPQPFSGLPLLIALRECERLAGAVDEAHVRRFSLIYTTARAAIADATQGPK